MTDTERIDALVKIMLASTVWIADEKFTDEFKAIRQALKDDLLLKGLIGKGPTG